MPLISAISPLSRTQVQPEDLFALANFYNEKSQAVSFYFSTASEPDRSHRADLIAIKQLARDIISQRFDQQPWSGQVLADLDGVMEAAERMTESFLGFKAIFACREEHIWQEFELPLLLPTLHLRAGKRFDLVALLHAMEACRPYCVVLAEHGRARGFVVRGTQIDELSEGFAKGSLRVHANDSRDGWSHHIAGDQKEHAQAYVRELAREIQRFKAAHRCKDILIGCRDDFWSEIHPYLDGHVMPLPARFSMPTFDISIADLLEVVQPVFQEEQRQRHADLIAVIRENPRHGAIGLPAVLKGLAEGRVHTLLLDPVLKEVAAECAGCGALLMDPSRPCVSCGSSKTSAASPQEFLIRKALATGAEIVPMDLFDLPVKDGVAALLRY